MNLYVNEIFTSIQGEGVHTGLATTFIRLSGCNLRCSWCDTPYALEMSQGRRIPISDILKEISDRAVRNVCITGGEPLFQEGTKYLIEGLVREGFRVDLETNGSMDISGIDRSLGNVLMSMDVKLPSSGEEDSFLVENLAHIRNGDQLKFIIANMEDLDAAFSFIENHLPKCNLILTPVDNRGGEVIVEELLKRIDEEGSNTPLSSILQRARVMIQTHKVIWGSEKKGV